MVFWELTSLTSFMLIAYWYHREDARRGARMALIVTVGGGLSLLLGVLMLGGIVGSYDLDAVLASGDIIRAHPWYAPVLLLIVAGRVHQERAVPVPFLVAPGHGRAHSGVGLSAFGDDGEGGRIPARAPVARASTGRTCGSG